MLEVGFSVDVHDDVLARRDAAENATCVVAEETRRA